MTYLIIILLVLLLAWAVAHTLKKAKKGGGCCGEHEQEEKKIAAKDRNKGHYPYTTTLSIGGMTCENCARKVENALNAIPDTWAKVKKSTDTAEVRTKTPPDIAALREVVRNAGYVVLQANAPKSLQC